MIDKIDLAFKQYLLFSMAEEICVNNLPQHVQIVFENPVQLFSGYPVFSLIVHDKMVLVETILNADKETGKHTTTTKGTESPNFVAAVMLMCRREINYTEVERPDFNVVLS